MTRLILAHLVERSERDRRLSDLGLELSNAEQEPSRAHFEVWMSPDLDDESVIHYVDDLPIGQRYFMVTGDHRWEEGVVASFPILTETEVFERARAARTDPERIAATYMVALVAGPGTRDEALSLLRASLHHPSEEVRHAAILASGYTTLSALGEDLVELATRDGSPRVRDRAQRMLQQVAQHGWEE